MPRLSAIDLAMFALETDARPFNIGPLIVLTPPRRVRGDFAGRLLERMLEHPAGPPFSYRLRMPAAGIAALEEDPGLDLANHVHRRKLPAPGTLAQLFRMVCRIHETRLDRSRPLWELYVIDGLENGKVALYGKVHHGIIDGRTFVKAMSHWLATSPRTRTVHAFWEGLPRSPRPERPPADPAERIGSAARRASELAVSALGLGRMLGTQALNTLGMSEGDPLPMTTVPDAFHGEVTAARSFAYCVLPLAEVKAFGKAHGASVNDVLLTVLDMAMVRLLRKDGKRPAVPLVADMPLALTGAHGGNQIAVLQLPLGAPDATPAERLAAICAQSRRLKDLLQRESAESVMLYTTLVHAIPAVAERLGVKRALNVSNVIVSNPFGLAEPRFLMGAEVSLALPVSVIAAGQMLNITAVTLADRLQIGFLAMPRAVPRVDRLAAYTVDAFAVLQRAAAVPA
jgi:diacylglycerol O-acyltransferase